VQTHALAVQPDGTLDLEQIRGAVHPGDLHHARTVLLVLENTKDGRVLPLDYLEEVEELLVHLGLGAHLDGARLFNAAAYLEVPPSRLTRPFETVTVCLSKGLGAPVGSVLCGSAELIGRARRWRKMLGGGMRQVGVLAAAGLVALERRDALKRDHAMAQQLSDALSRLEVDVQVHRCATNMIYLSLPLAMSEVEEMRSALGSVGVVWPGGTAVGDRCWFRLVTHRDLPADAVQRVSEALDSFSRGLLQQRQPAAQAR
jgi:threonine aldolase